MVLSVTSGPLVLYQNYVVNDNPPGGNGNSRFDPGESGKVVVAVRSLGLQDAQSVTAQLKSANPLFVITHATSSYGTIPTGTTQNNGSDPFEATAGASIAPGSVVPCTLLLHCDNWSHDWTSILYITVGAPLRSPGTIIWGPKQVPSPPAVYGLYGLAYSSGDNRIYCTHFRSRLIYVYYADSLLTSFGTIPAPNNETACTDIKYCAYDNTFWVASNQTKRVYKIDASGTVLRYFSNPANDYPVGLGWDENTLTLYLIDRRAVNTNPGYIYATDTSGNQVQTRISIPFVSYAGARCLGVDITNSNPLQPTLIMLFTWFSTSGTLDSIGIYELKHDVWQVLNSFKVSTATWNARGVEYDPRDGSLWITIMQNTSPPPPDNSICKVEGFHRPNAVEERKPFLVATGDIVSCRAAPNPFRGATRISYLLPNTASTRVIIYDAAGRTVRTWTSELLSAGEHSVTWNGRDAAGCMSTPGIYFYEVVTSNGKFTGKALLLK